MVNFKYL